jgi:hypothetical protein
MQMFGIDKRDIIIGDTRGTFIWLTHPFRLRIIISDCIAVSWDRSYISGSCVQSNEHLLSVPANPHGSHVSEALQENNTVQLDQS